MTGPRATTVNIEVSIMVISLVRCSRAFCSGHSPIQEFLSEVCMCVCVGGGGGVPGLLVIKNNSDNFFSIICSISF